MRTSLGIWAFGSMVTRFVPVGYQPEHTNESTAVKVRRAVEGLGDLMDDYEFHYPGELNPDNLDEVRERSGWARDRDGVHGLAYGSAVRPGWVDGSRSGCAGGSTAVDAGDGRAGGGGGREHDLLAGNRGLQLSVPDVVRAGVGVVHRGDRPRRREVCAKHGVKLFLEHKNSEPAMKIFMRNIGMTLHVIHTLRRQGITNVQVNMDWQHLIMNGENLGEYAALLAAEGLLGHQHANSGWGTFDDDNMVGATAFMETVELALELKRANYGANGERLGFDLYPYTEDAVAAVKRSVLQWNFINGVAHKIDDDELRKAQAQQGRRPRLRARLRRTRRMSGGSLSQRLGQPRPRVPR